MRVLMVSKALVVAAYQRKAEEIARCGVDLTVGIPPSWRDRRGKQTADPQQVAGYCRRILPLRMNGHFHTHYYPTLAHELAQLRPDLLHMDEEPYNLATWLALRSARHLQIPALFFTWQNLDRRYPPPFRQMERANYRWAAAAIAGSAEAAEVLQRKGYRGTLAVIPQFGVDPALFAPAVGGRTPPRPLRIGYAGGLLPEKGVDLLLSACARLSVPWRLHLAGEGSAEPLLRRMAADLGVAERIEFAGRVASTAMPAFYQGLDLFVLPSRTTPTWKEQFGRVLVEAMACSVPVIGSRSGEIPHVIGDAGLIFPEGDAEALGRLLQRLAADPDERQRLGEAGRIRVLERYSMAQIAAQTVALYAQVLGRAWPGSGK